ncbi:MAG: hypothetical protein FWD39_06870 [Clostridiales bacterium]|nr:hypothetical protein [Clostridiales bacterium]
MKDQMLSLVINTRREGSREKKKELINLDMITFENVGVEILGLEMYKIRFRMSKTKNILEVKPSEQSDIYI